MDTKPMLTSMLTDLRRWSFFTGFLLGGASVVIVLSVALELDRPYGLVSLGMLGLGWLAGRRARFFEYRLHLWTQVRPLDELPDYRAR